MRHDMSIAALASAAGQPSPATGDVIFALASGGGKAPIAVLRLSGPRVKDVLQTLCGVVPAPRLATLRRLAGRDGVLDEALVLWFPGPASFTGEDVAELQLHGSRAVVQSVMAELRRMGGRPAAPGEFARRAFRNGKRDLASLEGLADLIDAETEMQRRLALRQMSGAVGDTVARWMSELLELQALVEAELDFSDEGDVATDLSSVRAGARRIGREMAQATDGADAARRLRDGFSIVIAGPPNVGKSSLLNAIARRELAIVTAMPGTTRDIIEAPVDLGGLPVVLADTAGQRDTEDAIEAIGVQRAQARAAEADLVWWLALDSAGAAAAPPGAVVIASQRDRFADEPTPRWAQFAISALTGAGLDTLLDAARGQLSALASAADGALVVRERHAAALASAEAALQRVADPASVAEFMAEDLRLARREIGAIVGAQGVEDVLDQIFGRFCIGK